TVPPLTPAGRYFVVARADNANALAESNEANNEGASSTRLTVGPDILVTAAATATTSAAPGTNVSVRYTLKNQGAGPTGAFAVSVALAPTSDLTGASDIPVGVTRSGIVLGVGTKAS